MPDLGLIAAAAAESRAKKVAREVAESVARETAALVASEEAARLYAENPPVDGKAGLDSVIPGPKGDPGDKGDKGDPGTDGKDGKDGRDGEDGKDGRDGIDGISAPRQMGRGGGGGGSGLTVGSTQVNRLAAGTNVTLTVAAGTATIAASGGGAVAASDVTYSPAVLGETQGQAVAEALAAQAIFTTVALTAAQIKLLAYDSVPVEIIPAQPGKAVMVLAAAFELICGTVGYASAAGNSLSLDPVGLTFEDAEGYFVDTVAPERYMLRMTQGHFSVLALTSGGTPSTTISLTTNPTLGNGTARVHVLYRLIDLA